jgi:hypothetical protein
MSTQPQSLPLPSTPISIPISTTELQTGKLSQKNLEIAIRALKRDGLLVLEDLIPHDVLNKLNERMVADAYELQGRKDSPFNYNRGNIQQDPLLTREFWDARVYISKL